MKTRIPAALLLFAAAACADGGQSPLRAPDEALLAVAPSATPASITITPNVVWAALDADSVHVTATVLDSVGNPVTGIRVRWKVEKPAVASVVPTGPVSSKVSLLGAGDTRVKAWVPTTGTAYIQTTMMLRVRQAPVIASIDVTPARDSVLALGRTRTFTVAALAPDGAPVLDPAVWSSADPSIATVDQSGVVAGVGRGSTYIRATIGSAADSARILVRNVAGSLTLSLAADSVHVMTPAATSIFNAALLNLDGAVVSDRSPSWRSTNSAVATAAAGSFAGSSWAGTITAGGEGMAEIISESSPILTQYNEADSAMVLVMAAPGTPVLTFSNGPRTFIVTFADNSAVETIYEVWRRNITDSGAWVLAGTVPGTAGTGSRQFSEQGLTNNKFFEYRVRACKTVVTSVCGANTDVSNNVKF